MRKVRSRKSKRREKVIRSGGSHRSGIYRSGTAPAQGEPVYEVAGIDFQDCIDIIRRINDTALLTRAIILIGQRIEELTGPSGGEPSGGGPSGGGPSGGGPSGGGGEWISQSLGSPPIWWDGTGERPPQYR